MLLTVAIVPSNGNPEIDVSQLPVAADYQIYRGDTSGNWTLMADLGALDPTAGGSYVDTATTLQNDTTYRYGIFDDNGNLLDSATLVIAIHLSGNAVGNTAHLSWDNNSPSFNFMLTGGNNSSYGLNLGNASSYTDTNLAFNSWYSYTLDETTTNQWSSIEVWTPPGALAGLNAQAVSATEIYVTGVNSPGDMNIYRGDTADFPADAAHRVASDVAFFDDTTVVPGTRYYYQATNYNSNTGLESSPVSAFATTPGGEPVVAGRSIHATAGTAYSSTIATFSQSGTDGQPADYSASINWGDGSSTDSTSGRDPAHAVTITANPSGGFSVQGKHTYAASVGTPPAATVAVMHNPSMLRGTASVPVQIVAPIAPIVSANTLSLVQGQPYSGSIASFTASGPQTSPSDYTARINWGDGSPAGIGAIANGPGNTFVVSAPHTYSTLGNHTLSVDVTLTTGALSGSGTATATVAAPGVVVPPATRVRAVAYSPTQANVSWLAATPAAAVAGYLIEDTSDGTNFFTVATLPGTGTGGAPLSIRAANLKPGATYTFRVIARNASPVNAIPTYSLPITMAKSDGTGGDDGSSPGPTPAPGDQPPNSPSIGDPATNGGGIDNTEGWYRLTVDSGDENLIKGDSGDTSTGFLRILTGEESATNPDATVWVHAQSWKDAAERELSGTATNTHTGQSYNWNADDTSGALDARDNPDIAGAGAHAIVMEDLFDQPNDDLDYNDNYFNVTVDRLSIDSVTAADPQNADNQVTSTDLTPTTDLYVIEKQSTDGSPVSTTVNLSAILSPADAGDEAKPHAIWSLKRGGTKISTGIFDANDVVLPTTDTQGDFELDAGVDNNDNHVLDAPASPSAGGGEVTQKIRIHAVKIDVRINGTDATNDDAVRKSYEGFGTDIPASNPSVLGEVRLARPLPEDITVDLDNPDGNLNLESDSASTSTTPAADVAPTLTLSKDGTWKSFNIFGVQVSRTIGDTSVRVMAHLPGYDGGVIVQALEKPMTVFWFTNPSITNTPNGNYAVVGGKYTVDTRTNKDASSVSLAGQATVEPAGLDGTIPQLANLRIGIVQNLWSSTRIQYGINPHAPAKHLPNIAPVESKDTLTLTSTIEEHLNDRIDDVTAPLFDGPGRQGGAAGEGIPFGYQVESGKAATSADTADFGAPTDINGQGSYLDNGIVKNTKVAWTLNKVTMNSEFRTWVVLYDIAGNPAINVIAPLAENGWKISVDSSNANPATQAATQIALFGLGAGIDPLDTPVLTSSSGASANKATASTPLVPTYGANVIQNTPGF